jgi:hypothetical protein
MPLCFRVKGPRKGNATICWSFTLEARSTELRPARGKFRNNFAIKPLT